MAAAVPSSTCNTSIKNKIAVYNCVSSLNLNANKSRNNEDAKQSENHSNDELIVESKISDKRTSDNHIDDNYTGDNYTGDNYTDDKYTGDNHIDDNYSGDNYTVDNHTGDNHTDDQQSDLMSKDKLSTEMNGLNDQSYSENVHLNKQTELELYLTNTSASVYQTKKSAYLSSCDLKLDDENYLNNKKMKNGQAYCVQSNLDKSLNKLNSIENNIGDQSIVTSLKDDHCVTGVGGDGEPNDLINRTNCIKTDYQLKNCVNDHQVNAINSLSATGDCESNCGERCCVKLEQHESNTNRTTVKSTDRKESLTEQMDTDNELYTRTQLDQTTITDDKSDDEQMDISQCDQLKALATNDRSFQTKPNSDDTYSSTSLCSTPSELISCSDLEQMDTTVNEHPTSVKQSEVLNKKSIDELLNDEAHDDVNSSSKKQCSANSDKVEQHSGKETKDDSSAETEISSSDKCSTNSTNRVPDEVSQLFNYIIEFIKLN